ncbi:MAG TPA: glycosyltransferase [Pyrinomonadaceae bacterium]
MYHSTCEEETGFIRSVFGPEAKIVEIPNFVEMPPLADRAGEKYLLYLGRFHRKKGIENLISALSMTDEFLRSDYILKIAGRGPSAYEKKLRELVAELDLEKRVQFVGQVEGEEKQKLLAGAYWTLMPSHTENFGMVVLESLAQNTPVVASTGSPWEVLETEKLGFWRGNSPEELSQILKCILEMDSSEYENYRRRGREFVKRNYDISQNIGRWIETYKSLG